MSLRSAENSQNNESELSLSTRIKLFWTLVAFTLSACAQGVEANPALIPSAGGNGGNESPTQELNPSTNIETPTPYPDLIADTMAVAQPPSEDETAQLNKLLQTQLIQYKGDPQKVFNEPNKSVCSSFERYLIDESDEVTLCRTLIEGEEMLVAFTQSGEAVELIGVRLGNVKVYGIWTNQGKIVDSDVEGAGFVPFVGKGSDGADYIYSEKTKLFHKIEGKSEVLNDLGVNKILVELEGGTLVRPNQIIFDNGDIYEETEDGSWVKVESVKTFTDQYGLEVVLSDQTLENGAIVIDEILPPEKYDGNEAAQAKWLKYFDAERLGFDAGATQWVKTPDDAVQLVDSSDPTKAIAEYRYIPWLDLSGVVWNWKNFVEADGENVLFDVCKIWELMRKGGAPVDKDGVLDFMKALDARESSMVSGGYDIMYGNGNDIKLGTRGGSISPEDGESIVVYRQLRYSNNEGFLVTRDAKENSIILYLENMEWDFYAH